MEEIIAQLTRSYHGAAFAGVAVAYVLLAAFLENWIERSCDTQDETMTGNVAAALRRAGIFLALAVANVGYLVSGAAGSGTFGEALTAFAIEGAVMTGLILVATRITDLLILKGIRNGQAIAGGNTAVGTVEFGAYVATGFIAWGAFAGDGGTIGLAVGFFAIGQAALVLTTWLYEAMTPFSVMENLRRGNTAAGVMLAGALIAMSLILRGAIIGPFGGWGEDLLAIGVAVGAGYLLLVASSLVIDALLLPGRRIGDLVAADGNTAAALIVSAVKVAVAAVIAAVVI